MGRNRKKDIWAHFTPLGAMGTEVSPSDAVQVRCKVAACNWCKAPNTTRMKAHFDSCHANLVDEGPPVEDDVVPQEGVAVPSMVLLKKGDSRVFANLLFPTLFGRGICMGKGKLAKQEGEVSKAEILHHPNAKR